MRIRRRLPLTSPVVAAATLVAAIALASPPMAAAQGPAAPKAESLSGAVGETQTGLAAYYNQRLHGRRTASGARFDNSAMTTGHQSLHSRRRCG
jgi:rare lipoprotein A